MDEQQTSREQELRYEFADLIADIKILKKQQDMVVTESLARTIASLEHKLGEVKAEYSSLTGSTLTE